MLSGLGWGRQHRFGNHRPAALHQCQVKHLRCNCKAVRAPRRVSKSGCKAKPPIPYVLRWQGPRKHCFKLLRKHH